MDTRTLVLLLSPLVALQIILAIAVLVSMARKALPWGEKWPWALLIFVNTIGPIIYFVVGSNKLDDKAAQLQDSQENSL